MYVLLTTVFLSAVDSVRTNFKNVFYHNQTFLPGRVRAPLYRSGGAVTTKPD